jgi:hypothetical protein
MILALALNDFNILEKIYTSIPYSNISIVVQSVPPLLIPALLNFLRVCLADVVRQTTPVSEGQQFPTFTGGSPHFQYHLRWLTCIFTSPHLAALQHLDNSPLEEGNDSLLRQFGKL